MVLKDLIFFSFVDSKVFQLFINARRVNAHNYKKIKGATNYLKTKQ